ncbi:pyridoxal-dependent aspartate 1-decarboxylase PanP [Psychrobium sp. 1_MG-2023]|uniref:pyridoxal-dependent aspartate 1-decarboxylase PanP n=1 Tax=Psychrobium sp. 1_MG-2023 TaxID=3062624 RepID=UPI000C32BE6E|nr:putative pyridoxal-dependent aspartate 1-decarboxylase [Psychrobium sp. 1_MG-2023]MDP2559717.1 putative pyridoxal-dependent aspartate 1-decarboxylase [Psychrobium sp. 1_MG-2023]PKF59546.1 putative pyridoxal-dependent aspartate 1-decarboxylase [Alteromonadales bacterium alter-6D02]
MSILQRTASASIESLNRVFTVPEDQESTLGQIELEISQNLEGFLQQHIVAVEKDLQEVEKDFSESEIPNDPIFVSEQADFLLDKLVSQSVHTASPSFVGHMTSALPYFMLPLSKIMIALNQNLVKTETSKSFTPLERQVTGMLHRLVYEKSNDFYERFLHDQNYALGAFCSGGTIANITALWVARNNAFAVSKDFAGVHQEGLTSALLHHGYRGAAVLVSERGHYSLKKTADILGLGTNNIISIATDDNNRISMNALKAKCEELTEQKIKIMALVGIAGTTETGSVDPLDEMADLAEQYQCHFHVDGAWGAPTLFSKRYAPLLKGIERADSVTIDAHKQLYIPMGAGLVVFKDPAALHAIEHHAQYIIRKGSKDLGSKTLEGSRPGMAMLVHSGLKILGKSGYELLIEQGINKTRHFADLIEQHDDFELCSEPTLNILTYRYVPRWLQQELLDCDSETREKINASLNRFTKYLQKTQRGHGKAFVSRTQLTPARYQHDPIIVFRVVLANPLTTPQILKDILDEQAHLAIQTGAEVYQNKLLEIARK